MLILHKSQARDDLKVSTRVIYDEFQAQHHTVTIVDAEASLLEYTDRHGEEHFLFSTCSERSSATGKTIADSKARTAVVARRLAIPIPLSIVCRDIREARKFFATHHPLVVKPARGSGGKGVTTNVTTHEAFTNAYSYAKNYSHEVIVQQHIVGDDIRLLIVGGVFSSAVLRKPAHIIGDGIATIKESIAKANESPSRNDDTKSSLMHINKIAAQRFLGETINDIPDNGHEVRVVGPANVSLGGSLHEATHLVMPAMVRDAERLTNKLRLGICGVDMMWNQVTQQYYLLEVNATPGIDIHNDPFSGTSSDCVQKYVEWLVQ
ncbi:MAG: ATP-grasp domain-containing protein [Candidatus Saccharimonadales bacterium]